MHGTQKGNTQVQEKHSVQGNPKKENLTNVTVQNPNPKYRNELVKHNDLTWTYWELSMTAKIVTPDST